MSSNFEPYTSNTTFDLTSTTYPVYNCLYTKDIPTINDCSLTQARTQQKHILDIKNKYITTRNDYNEKIKSGNTAAFANHPVFKAAYDLSMAYQTLDASFQSREVIDMMELRNTVDNNLAELHNIRGTYSNDSNQKYNSAMLTSIFWTTIAVTLVFFAFRKL